ncbi:MAG: 4Fe-4S dicluster domain-containing protein [Thermoplasmata archaeon]
MGEAKTALLICGHWRESGELTDWLLDEDVEVHVIPELCHHFDFPRLLAGREIRRLILGLCREGSSIGELQTQARKVGLDPLGVEIVSLNGNGIERSKVLLAGALARARAFKGSKPENAKLYLSSRISRRSLLRLSLTEYRAVPSVDQGICAAGSECSLCVSVCPQSALEWSDGILGHDRSRCEPCGLCVTACPRGAVIDPACTPAQLEAQIRTLLSVGYSDPRGIVFLCQQSPEPKAASGWMPVKLPCVGMATPTWILAPLLLGAGAVAVLSCQRSCPTSQSRAIKQGVAFCREFLRLIGAPEDLVMLNPALEEPPREGRGTVPLEDPYSHKAHANVLTKLASEYGRSRVILEHPLSPVGVVEIRDDACTACGMCAATCPTSALTHEEGEEGVTLSFDAGECVACGLCLSKCPERGRGAIILHKIVNLELLSQGRMPVYVERMARCIACGAPIASAKMLGRLEELLGSEHAPVMPLISSHCMDCRVMAHG